MSDFEGDGPAALADVDFPAQRQACIESVIAAREVIRQKSGATKGEILAELRPEKNHRIGLVAAQAVGKLNEVDWYREWWWKNVATPGLRGFSDISPPDNTNKQWRLSEDTTNSVGANDTDEDTVDIDELYSTLENPAAAPNAHAKAARKLLTELANARETGPRFVEPTSRLLSRPSLDADVTLLHCLTYLAQRHPDEVMKVTTQITDFVSMDDSSETATALECVATLVSHEAEPFVDLTPRLDALLDSENDEIRSNAIYILARLARTYPDEVKPLIPNLIAGIDAASSTDQGNALSALGHITATYPSAGKPAIEELIDLTDSTDDMVRANAIGVLADISKEHPDAVEPHLPTLIDCLHDDDEHVRGNAVSVVLHIGVADQDAVSEAVPGLIELLDDPSPTVRRNVCKALGNLEVVVAIEQLRERTRSDPDEDVRKLAEWAVNEIE